VALSQSLLSRYPLDSHVWHTLGRVYLDCGKRAELLAVIERLRACPQGEVFAALLLALWHLSQREWAPAGAQIDQLISLAPQMPLPRILRVEWLAHANATVDERIKACRDVLRLQPANLDVKRVLKSLEAAPVRPVRASHWPTLIIGGEMPAGAAMS
jgi:hypothetical protein